MEERGKITTYSGREFYAFNPQLDQIELTDIAHALSLICRYSGHCKFFYSVAQHSIGVSQILKELGYSEYIQLFGLLHDASESYICDIPKDIKHNMPEYQLIEKKIQDTIWDKYKLEYTIQIHDIVKQADNMMLIQEAKVLMRDWETWGIPTYDKEIIIPIDDVPQRLVEKEFLIRFDNLFREAHRFKLGVLDKN